MEYEPSNHILMPKCFWCKQVKPEKDFRLTKLDLLHEVCKECEKQPLVYCAFCGRPFRSSQFHKVSPSLYECNECHENTLEIIEKNFELRILWKLNQLIRNTQRMSENLIGNLRDRLFETMDGLKAGTITPEVAAQITDVAKTIIDSARAENEFIKLTGSAGSGFIPIAENGNALKQISG